MITAADKMALFSDEIQRCSSDFVYFCENHLKIIDRDGNLIDFRLKPAQIELLRKIEMNPWQMVLKARQLGSSTLIAAIFFWKSLFTPNERSLIVAHTHEAVRNIYRIYKTFYDHLPKFLQFRTRTSSANEIVFFHGGTVRISSASGQNFRGATYNNIHCSEVAFWKDIAMTVAGLFQTATGNSSIIIETTAQGLNGFHSMWVDQNNGFDKTFISWLLEPDYSLDEIDIKPTEQLIEYGKEWGLTQGQLWWAAQTLAIRCTNSWAIFCQEYAVDELTCFISSGDRFFDEVYPHAQFDTGYIEYEAPGKNQAYVMGVDTAAGSTTGDFSAFAVLDVTGTRRKIVSTFVNRESPLNFARLVHSECKKYNCTVVVESNSYGLSVIEYLRHQEWGKLYTNEKYDDINKAWTSKIGFNTNSRTRPILLSGIQGAINGHALVPDDERLQFQINTFIYNEKGRPDHANGAHDDLIIAVALALQGIDQAMIDVVMRRREPPANLPEVLSLERKTGKSVSELQEEGYFCYTNEEELFTTVEH